MNHQYLESLNPLEVYCNTFKKTVWLFIIDASVYITVSYCYMIWFVSNNGS